MLLYFLIICATEFLIVNYGSHAAGIINRTTKTKNATKITLGPVNSYTSNKTTTSREETAMGNVLGIIKGQKLSTAETSAHKISKRATTSPGSAIVPKRAAETVRSSLTRDERTLRWLFPLLRNATGNTDALGLFNGNGLLPVLLTNLLSNDNVGVIAASLISALRDRATTPAATTGSAAAATTSPQQNITNNYYSTSSYPYYYAPYGYYYG